MSLTRPWTTRSHSVAPGCEFVAVEHTVLVPIEREPLSRAGRHARVRESLSFRSSCECTQLRIGELAVQGVVPKLSETPGEIKHLGADLGAHNREIYMDGLGLSEKELADLREEGVI